MSEIQLESMERLSDSPEYRGPICPFCETEVETLLMKEIRSNFGRRYLYYCSACRKVMGVSHRKGFWMG